MVKKSFPYNTVPLAASWGCKDWGQDLNTLLPVLQETGSVESWEYKRLCFQCL